MTNRITGWLATASASNAIAQASKAAVDGRQHIIYAIDLSFSTTPAAPVRWELLDGSTSPGTLVASGYVLASKTIDFPAGVSIPVGHAVDLVLAAGGGIGSANLHGNTQ